MNKVWSRLGVWLANMLWLAACIPGWITFWLSAHRVRRTQTLLLSRLLRTNDSTEIGRLHRFRDIRTVEDYRAVPLSEYEDYLPFIDRIRAGFPSVLTHGPVERLHPTSGSVAATKLIPYTRVLRREFGAAIDPWIASLYLTFPSLLSGRHYWSISPAVAPSQDTGLRPGIGFGDDTEYLGPVQRRLARALFAVPPEVARLTNHDAFEYLTLLFLVREPNLRLISIWHPSFLTVLIRALPQHLPTILRDIEAGTINDGVALTADLRRTLESRLTPNPARARELRAIDPAVPDYAGRIWPRLRVISCWTEGHSESGVAELRCQFPRAVVQGKGLTATEGIVSFPVGRNGRRVCAIRSHYFEFIDSETQEIKNAWGLERGRTYAVVLTTGGGLYRYKLHDVVLVTEFLRGVPCLAFVGRDNLISDLVGEKLNCLHVASCLRLIEEDLGLHFSFAMLAPAQDRGTPGYALYIQAPAGARPDYAQLAATLEHCLRANFHYDHARRLGQLQHLRIFLITGDAIGAYRDFMLGRGMKAGDIKFMPLSTDTEWQTRFQGRFVI